MKKKIFLTTVLITSLIVVGVFVLPKDEAPSDVAIQSFEGQRGMTSGPREHNRIAITYDSPSEFLIELDTAKRIAAEGNTDQAARILAELYGDRESLTDSEEMELLSLYAKLLIELGSNQEAIAALEDLFAIQNIPKDIKLDAIQSLSQALMAEEEWEQAVVQFDSWLGQSDIRDPEILLNLSYAYYQQEQWEDALTPVVEHVELLIESGEEITQERLMYLKGLAVLTNDWNNAAWVTQVLISEFNNIRDWRDLIVIYRRSENEAAVDQVFRDAEAAGILEELESDLGLR